LRHRAAGATVWLQLRGVTRVAAREGVFELRRGDWLVLDRDSCPELQADRNALTLGLTLAPLAVSERRRSELLPGLGWMPVADRRIAMRLWRNGAGQEGAGQGREPASPHDRPQDDRAHAIQAAVAHLSGLQGRLDPAIARCPGRSVARKRQVFARLQRARLFLQGHCDRVVRLGELAALTSFSSWYLSKTFHAIYRESPQSASVRLRLERACALLVGSDRAIGEVGVACGFDNSCSFARAFRARYGLTASDYRHAHRSVRTCIRPDDIGLASAQASDSRDGNTHAEQVRKEHSLAGLKSAGGSSPGVFEFREAELTAFAAAGGLDRDKHDDAARRDSVACAKLGTGCEQIWTRDSNINALM
jgi:AraC family transcriptional regulator